ncbi:hypothetical protein SIL87_08490 [Acidiphilium acidophilum]|uniref:Uncharacterized protein n=1 Tax=Acidiphilium acidophilum TaxID=76588 RepID=A0AAW9DQ68_ACIAO|nr:hypothetical protein [Acidiphilium acidophilum]
MTEAPRPHEALTETLKAIFAGFHREAVRLAQHHRAAMPMVTLLLGYFNRVVIRFAQSAAKPAAPPKPIREPALETPETAPPTPSRPRKPSPFSTQFAWLLHLLPTTPTTGVVAAQAHYDLIAFVNSPELIALLAAKPSLGRILRPICRMFGVNLPDHLRPPPRERRQRKPNPNPKPKRIIWPIPLDPADIRIPDANYHGVHFGPGNRFWPPRRKYRKICP